MRTQSYSHDLQVSARPHAVHTHATNNRYNSVNANSFQSVFPEKLFVHLHNLTALREEDSRCLRATLVRDRVVISCNERSRQQHIPIHIKQNHHKKLHAKRRKCLRYSRRRACSFVNARVLCNHPVSAPCSKPHSFRRTNI